MSTRPRSIRLLTLLLLSGCSEGVFDTATEPDTQVAPTVALAPVSETLADQESCEVSALSATYRDDDSPARGEITVQWHSATTTSAAISAEIEGAAPEAEVVAAGQTSLILGTRIQDSDETDGDVKVAIHVELACGASLRQVFVFADPIKSCPVAQLDDIAEREAVFYECAERWLAQGEGCGPDGYPVGYGARYARRFYEETRPRMSEAGESWVDQTLVCLQDRLRSAIAIGTSCADVSALAFATHPDCYAESGFCTLPLPDILNAALTIDGADLLSEDGVRQLIGVLPECGEEYAELLTDKSPDVQVAALP